MAFGNTRQAKKKKFRDNEPVDVGISILPEMQGTVNTYLDELSDLDEYSEW